MSDKQELSSELSRDLNIFHLIMMGLGTMMGAGLFVGIGVCMGINGPGGLLLTFALSGLTALFSAMSFAELASAIPRAGGTYNFVRVAYGRSASFFAGWLEWLGSCAAAAFYATVLSLYTLDFLREAGWLGWTTGGAVWERLFAAFIVLLFVLMNFRGRQKAAKVATVFTVGQLLFVAVVIIAGLLKLYRHPERLENFEPFCGTGESWQLLGAMGLVYLAFAGFEVMAQAGDETLSPRKTIPKAMLYSVYIAMLCYLLVTVAVVVSMRPDAAQLGGLSVSEWIGGQQALGFGRSVAYIFGSHGMLVVTLGVIFAATGALNATIYSATRTAYALGRDGMLPEWLHRVHPQVKTPQHAVVCSALIALVLTLSLDAKLGLATAGSVFLMLFFWVNLSAIRVRYRFGDELKYGYITPLFPLFPIVAILLQAAMLWGIFCINWLPVAIAAGWLVIGAAIFMIYSRSHAKTTDEEILVLEEKNGEPSALQQAPTFMISVANPENVYGLVKNTFKLSSAKKADIELLHMVRVPEHVPLHDAEKFMNDGREGIVEAMLYFCGTASVSTTIRYCRSISRGIISALREKKTDTLILGWHGEPTGRLFNYGSTIDPIIERAGCNVVVMKNCSASDKYKKILVPIAGGRNGAYALEVASVLAGHEGEVTAFTVSTPGRKFDLETYVTAEALERDLETSNIIYRSVAASKPADAILEASKDYDLVVMGCTAESALQRMAVASIPEVVAVDCEKPLLVVKSAGGLRGAIGQWL